MSPKLQLTLLGQPSIQKGDKQIDNLPSRAAEALFYYIACSQKPFAREKLAELLWPERTSAQALTNLRTVLTALKREFEEHLLISRDTLAFNAESNFWLDVNEFERQLNDLGFPDKATIPINSAAADRLQNALNLYQGDFLEGFHLRDGQGFEEWAMLLREHLKQLAHAGFRSLTRYYLEKGQYAAGLISASKWIRLDPYDEEACRAQMLIFIRTGQRSASLQLYQTLKEKLVQDLGVIPSSATTELYNQFQQLDYPPTVNLPSYSTEFVGRRNELAELERLLISAESRLITITAPGGMGKTRLAAAAARFISERKPGQFIHGIYFISLINIDVAQDIPARIAEAIGFHFHGTASLQSQLLEYLKERETLLVLDNFEHLFDESSGGIAILVNLLRGAPGAHLLVTSRKRLNLYDEIVFDISGLETPKDANFDMGDASAVDLFAQSARRLYRDYSIKNTEKTSVVRICQLVNGMPLAIELASAWLREYSCEQIACQIEEDLDFLTSSYQDVSAGHRSLRAVFEHSWRLLSPAEQSAFARLSVFRGGFTSEAVDEVIVSGLGINSPEIGSGELLLSDLADKSLLQRQLDGRYDIHPMLLQYAAEKLSASISDLEVVSSRHAAYYLKFLTNLSDGESPEQRAAIRLERDNIRYAWEHAAKMNMVQGLAQTAGILHSFFSAQSWFQEGIDLFEYVLNTLAQKDALENYDLMCDLFGRKARMHTQIGQLDYARVDLQKASTYLERMEDSSLRSRVLDSMAITNYYAGEYLQATKLAKESLQISEQMNNLDGVAFALNFLGSCSKAQGEYEQCRTYFERAVETYHLMQDEIGAAMVLNNLGNLLQIQEDFPSAQEYYLQSSRIFRAQEHLHGAATTLANAGKLAGRRGDYDLARSFLIESLELKRKINDQRGEAVALAGLGDVDLLVGLNAEAQKQFLQALVLALRVGDVQLMLEILTAIADLTRNQMRTELSARLLAYILEHSGASDEARTRALRLKSGTIISQKDHGFWGGQKIEDVAASVIREL